MLGKGVGLSSVPDIQMKSQPRNVSTGEVDTGESLGFTEVSLAKLMSYRFIEKPSLKR